MDNDQECTDNTDDFATKLTPEQRERLRRIHEAFYHCYLRENSPEFANRPNWETYLEEYLKERLRDDGKAQEGSK